MNASRMMSRVFFCVCIMVALAEPGSAQTASQPVRLTKLEAPVEMAAGAVGHFRVLRNAEAARPVNYLWDLGDGTLSVGALVSHAYSRPGTYALTVVARNGAGADTLRSEVRVLAARMGARVEENVEEAAVEEGALVHSEVEKTEVETNATAPRRTHARATRAALFGSGGLSVEKGGYTWVLMSDLWEERAHDRMRRYRLRGFRSDVYVDDSGAGTPAQRVVVGQFETVEEALLARPWLPVDEVRPILLMLSPSPKGAERPVQP